MTTHHNDPQIAAALAYEGIARLEKAMQEVKLTGADVGVRLTKLETNLEKLLESDPAIKIARLEERVKANEDSIRSNEDTVRGLNKKILGAGGGGAAVGIVGTIVALLDVIG